MRPRVATLLPVLAGLALLAGLLAPASQPTRGADKDEKKPARIGFEKQILPVLNKYCLQCHSGAKPRAGFSLDRIKTDSQADQDRKLWDKVHQVLAAREMPPANKPQPTAVERDLLLQYLDQQLSAVDCSKGIDPGRVTIRRLNRTEYDNTIRDLLGVDFKPADDFPADDVGYGFDNIGDVLTVSPLLMEKYLAAAERIVALAMIPKRGGPSVNRYQGRQLQSTVPNATTYSRGGFITLGNNGELWVRHRFPVDGEYKIRVRAGGEQAGKENVKMAIRLNGREVQVHEVRATRDRLQSYEVSVKLKAGEHKIAAAFLNDFFDDKATDPSKKDRNLIVQWIEITSPSIADNKDPYSRIMIVKPDDKVSKEEAARKILENFARKAFRRPVTRAEVDRYLKLVKLALDQGDDFDKGIGLAIQAILVSPYFLFRIEQDPRPNEPPIRTLSEHELAVRLSYFLWSSMPDDQLFAEADAGTLRKNLDAQVKRMLADPKSREFVENFPGQWLTIKNLYNFKPDPTLFPTYDDRLRDAMIREVELFFEAVMKEDRSILDFIDADFTFVNNRLARHYGMREERFNRFRQGDPFRRVTLSKDDVRGGLLTMAAVLTVTSNPTRTSPVKRGKWILENVLNSPPPPAPPEVPELSEDKKIVESASLRKRMEAHRVRPDCASCHAKLDPLGFGFESFDAIGAWRTMDGKFPVDASGELPSGEKFNGPRELKKILKSRKDAFARCLAEKMLTYALGRGLEYFDRCAIDNIVKALARNDYRFSTLVLEIVKSDPFQKRRVLRGEKK